MPQFTPNKKGYDPEQVDAFIATQTQQLRDATLRASAHEQALAESNAALEVARQRIGELEGAQDAFAATATNQAAPPVELPETARTLGEQVQKILNDAWESAAAIKVHADAEITAARAQADQEITAARAQADQEITAQREASEAALAERNEKAAALQRDIEERIASVDAEVDRRRTEGDMKLAEERAIAEREIAARREEGEAELSRRSAELAEREEAKERELDLKFADKRAEAEEEHVRLVDELAAKRAAAEADLAAIGTRRDEVTIQLAEVEAKLRDLMGAVGSKLSPQPASSQVAATEITTAPEHDATPGELPEPPAPPAPAAESAEEGAAPEPVSPEGTAGGDAPDKSTPGVEAMRRTSVPFESEEKAVTPSHTPEAPKIDPMGASSVPYEEEPVPAQAAPSTNGASGGGGSDAVGPVEGDGPDTMTVPTIAGVIEVPVEH